MNFILKKHCSIDLQRTTEYILEKLCLGNKYYRSSIKKLPN